VTHIPAHKLQRSRCYRSSHCVVPCQVLLKLRRGASEVSVQLQRVANEEAAALMRRSYASVESEGLRRSHNSFE
jgi:hypothetical protein